MSNYNKSSISLNLEFGLDAWIGNRWSLNAISERLIKEGHVGREGRSTPLQIPIVDQVCFGRTPHQSASTMTAIP